MPCAFYFNYNVVFSLTVRKNYSAQKRDKLEEKDRLWLGRILYGWLVLYHLITKYKPKKYAHEVLVKTSQSEKRLAFSRLLYGALGRDLCAMATSTPGQLNNMLAMWMGSGVVPDLESDMNITLENPLMFKRYITPTDMTWVVKKLAALHITVGGKGPPKKPGRKPAGKRLPYERGGRASYIEMSKDMEGMIKALSNPILREIVYNSLSESGLLFRFIKFMKLAEFYAIMEDPSFTQQAAIATKIPVVNQEKIDLLRQRLLKLTNRELYREAHKWSRISVEQRWHKDDTIFLLGLFYKLFNP